MNNQEKLKAIMDYVEGRGFDVINAPYEGMIHHEETIFNHDFCKAVFGEGRMKRCEKEVILERPL